jgi:hypothetical protein
MQVFRLIKLKTIHDNSYQAFVTDMGPLECLLLGSKFCTFVSAPEAK